MNKTVNNNEVKFSERLAYGMGELSTCAMFTMFASLLVFFYTDVIGVKPGTVGFIIAISQVFNGVSDIAAGFIVDRTRSKYGRVRVWLLRMAIPYMLASVLLMTVPVASEVVRGIYIFFTYNLMLTVVYTMTQLPYATLLTYLTRSQEERAKINLIRMTLSPIGNVAITLGFLPLVELLGGGQSAWIKATTIYGFICSALLLWCFFFTKERVHVIDETYGEKIPVKKTVSILLQNKYFIISFLFILALACYQTISQTMLTYYCKSFLGHEKLMGTINFACQIMIIILTPVIGMLTGKMAKRNWCILGAVLIVIGTLFVPFAPRSVPVVFAGSLLRGAGLACEYAMQYLIIADVVEYGQWKTGLRTPATIQSAVSAGQKFGSGVCSAAIGAIMSWSGYNGLLSAAEQTPVALKTVSNLFIFGMIGSCVAIVAILAFYKLDKEYTGILKELLEREDLARKELEKDVVQEETFVELNGGCEKSIVPKKRRTKGLL